MVAVIVIKKNGNDDNGDKIHDNDNNGNMGDRDVDEEYKKI